MNRYDQISAEFIQAGCRTIRSEIQKLINSIWNKEELPEEWKESLLYLFIRREIKQILVIIGAYHFGSYVQHFIQHPAVKVNSICRGNYWGSSMRILTQYVSC